MTWFLQAQQGAPSMWPTWGFLIAMFAIFYFLIIRPQQKRTKQHKTMLQSLSKGDKVVTTGGILGTIVGGVGTLFGPIVGAFLLTPLGEMLTGLTEGMRIDGIKQFFWGMCVAVIVLFRPTGVWPWIAGLLKLDRKNDGDRA